MLGLTLVVGTVLVISATCSLFEAVLYSIRLSHIQSMVDAGKPSGRILTQLRGEIDRPIAAILSLNTIANTGGGALAGALAVSVLGQTWLGAFSALFTLAILFLAEIAPKTIGVVYAGQLGRFVARPLQVLVVFFAPLIWLTGLATRAIPGVDQQHGVSDEDLLALVGLGLRSGTFKQHEARIIENVLALEAKVARDIMTPRPVVFSLPVDRTVQQALEQPELSRYSRVPVIEGDLDDLVGVVHRTDILAAAARDQHDLTLERLMRPANFVVDSLSLDRLLRLFLERRQHLAAVIDEHGGIAGIVSLEDVVEELIGGEIIDETDHVSDPREVARRRREQLLASRPEVGDRTTDRHGRRTPGA